MRPVNRRLVNTMLSFYKKMHDPKLTMNERAIYFNGELSPRMRKVYDSIVNQVLRMEAEDERFIQ